MTLTGDPYPDEEPVPTRSEEDLTNERLRLLLARDIPVIVEAGAIRLRCGSFILDAPDGTANSATVVIDSKQLKWPQGLTFTLDGGHIGQLVLRLHARANLKLEPVDADPRSKEEILRDVRQAAVPFLRIGGFDAYPSAKARLFQATGLTPKDVA